MIAAGSLIDTPAGSLPAETLRPGDYVHALEAGKPVARPLRWVGQVHVDLARHPSPLRAAPVRLAAGSIGPRLPARDLLLSPDHAILLDGGLFQAQALRNGASIAQDTFHPRVTYVHLELARHGILGAEALPVESFLDIGNRMQVAAGRASMPDLGTVPGAAALAVWNARGCGKLLLDMASIVPAHAAALARARTLGWTLTDDPALAVLADEGEVPTARFGPGHWQARLPEATRAVRLASRSFVPNDLNAAVADRRRLGIAVRSVVLAGRALPARAFRRGWHLPEPEWRWTDGEARLAFTPLPQAATLELRTAPGAVPGYWLPPP